MKIGNEKINEAALPRGSLNVVTTVLQINCIHI